MICCDSGECRVFRGETITELSTLVSSGKGYAFEPFHSDEVTYNYMSLFDTPSA